MYHKVTIYLFVDFGRNWGFLLKYDYNLDFLNLSRSTPVNMNLYIFISQVPLMILTDKHEMPFFIKWLLFNNRKWQEKSKNKDLLMDRFPEDVYH